MSAGQRSQQIQMSREVIPHPSRRRFSDGLLLLTLVMSEERNLLLRHRHGGGVHDHFGSRRGEAPNLSEIGASREGPQSGGGRGAHEGGPHRNGVVLGALIVGAYALAEDERRGSEQLRLVVGGAGGRGERRGVGGAHGERHGGEAGGRGAGPGGGDDGRLGLAEEPLDGLAVGLVPQLARELEDARRAYYGHSYAAPAAVDLAVSVLGWRLLDGQRLRLVALLVND